jgi:hypothetical protein
VFGRFAPDIQPIIKSIEDRGLTITSPEGTLCNTLLTSKDSLLYILSFIGLARICLYTLREVMLINQRLKKGAVGSSYEFNDLSNELPMRNKGSYDEFVSKLENKDYRSKVVSVSFMIKEIV